MGVADLSPLMGRDGATRQAGRVVTSARKRRLLALVGEEEERLILRHDEVVVRGATRSGCRPKRNLFRPKKLNALFEER